MSPAESDALLTVLRDTPVETADEALQVLSAIVTALPPGDGIWCFTRLYQAVTADVRDALGTATFQNPKWLNRLDAVFANLYFDALSRFLRNDPGAPRAWYPLFAASSEPRTALQFAFAGMNAHINRDLSVALVAVCKETGTDLSRSSAEYRDYVAVNPILEKVEGRIKAEFLTGIFAVADHLLGKLGDVIANFSVVEARAGAWAHAETMWALRSNEILSAAFLDTLDGRVGFAGRGLHVPL
jgi:hypothetical protein